MALFGILGSPDKIVQEYINSGNLSVRADGFNGSLSYLQQTISRETDECARWVKEKEPLRSLGSGRDACSNGINNYYAEAMSRLQSESYSQENAVKAEFLFGPTRVILLAIVIVAIIIFFT